MACSDFVYAEDTLDYIIGSYRGDNYVMETYEPDCYVRLDAFQGIIYKREEKRDSNTIWQYGSQCVWPDEPGSTGGKRRFFPAAAALS